MSPVCLELPTGGPVIRGAGRAYDSHNYVSQPNGESSAVNVGCETRDRVMGKLIDHFLEPRRLVSEVVFTDRPLYVNKMP